MAAKNATNKRKCKRKVVHETLAAAQAAARKMNRLKDKRLPGSRPVHAYYCEFCHKYHTGHKPHGIPSRYSSL